MSSAFDIILQWRYSAATTKIIRWYYSGEVSIAPSQLLQLTVLLDVKDFPAIKIYEEVLPSVVEELTDPVIPYHRGSPYGGKGWDTADPTVGDVHQVRFVRFVYEYLNLVPI